MEKEIRDMDQKDTRTTWKIITCMKKENMKSNAFPSPQGEKGDSLQNYSEKAILYKINK